ncbi:hypothetical protein CJ469_00001 [Nocardia farcinica]|uniref:hypothetical protein n=1 Tax=Nocardia farcinica TaxID=37329 RepID=UPI000BF82060|nr:hypothetical protein [Nocardia farcinica]PFX04593.1 hypothetical protein CJ469_00001 [Nocardia farcinica]PFX09817.1 hypothetical protein CJ468_01657 [Nocardia farcinica]
MLLGGFGVWVADTPVPPAWRLPLIADLTLMAVLLLFAPAPGIDPHATTFHEHNHTTGSGWISVPILAMIAWASLRLHLWRTGRGGYPVRRSTTATVAHLAMTAAMILMAITHTLPH